ncbi:MAG: DJ-1/PfpI family protein [Luteimonas sp.]|nr:DJ-1/PfpI family protein [Luteimonas sp.]
MKRTIGVLGYEGVNALDVTGPAEAFAVAAQRDAAGSSKRCYDIVVVGATLDAFASESGIVFRPHVDLQHAPAFDTIIVPGGASLRTGACGAVFDHWLQQRADDTRRVASVCTGVYGLARAGLLDGRRVSTHWRYVQDLRERYPSLLVDSDALFIKDGSFYTAAGVTAGIDLALALIEEDHGSQLALSVAREMVVYLKRTGGQDQYSEPLQFQTRAVDAFDGLMAWMVSHLHQDLSVDRLAERAQLGARHFSRRFKSVFGATPADFVLSLRMAEGRRRLLLPRSNVDHIANSLGFGSGQAFRRAFERHFGLSPKAYRDRFGG